MIPGDSDNKGSACNAGDLGSIPGLGRSPGRQRGNPHQYSCLENPHGQRSLVGYSPQGCKESDMTEATKHNKTSMGFPGGARGKEPACQCRRLKRLRFDPWVREIPWRRAWQPTPVFLPGESHGERSPTGGLQSIGSQRIRHNWTDFIHIHTHTHRKRHKNECGVWIQSIYHLCFRCNEE